MIEKLLTPAEVAERLDVPIATLYQWRSRRIGPTGFRLGRHLRYRAENVDRWLAELEAIDTASR